MGNRIDFIQHVNAEPERLWTVLTRPDEMRRWFRVAEVSLPLTAGEPFRFTWAIGGRHAHSYGGTVLESVPNRRLRLEWHLPECDPPAVTTVTISLERSFYAEERDHGGTDLHIVHDGFPEHGRGAHEFDGSDRHWRQTVGELAAYVEGRPGKPVPRAVAGLLFVGGAPGRGLLVRDVIVDGPADRVGIRPGDRILAVNDRPLGALDEFHDWIDYCTPGDTGAFALVDRVVTVTLVSPRDL